MEDEGALHTPATRGRRFLKLAGMTASVATSFAKSRVQEMFQGPENRESRRAETHERMGERIAKTLGELKGAAMKMGQMASIAGDILPREVAQALQVLQKDSPPMPYSVVSSVVERELGSPPELVYRRFDPTPFASASIGQVHRAQLDDGREVVVKVQYPGVDDAVDSDLTHLKVALRASGLLRIDKQVLGRLFEEARARLHEELDYCNEADNVRLFREHHRRHPFVVVPEVVGERSAKRILTLTYEPGHTLQELDALGVAQEVRNQLGLNLFGLSLSQIFELGAIQSDPNPANFAFREDGRVVLYDFGCVKRIQPAIAEAYGRTLRCGIIEDYAGVEQGMLDLGARNPLGPPMSAAFYKDWRDVFFGPFLAGEFDYGRAAIHEEVKRRIPGFLKHLPSFQPPVEVVFIDRLMAGHYWNLKALRAQGRFLDHALGHVGLSAGEVRWHPGGAP
jgi:predicted unusual protein kinase regulating ubiquinone biosynthesis (AarF/ABC1/UbiB family)